MKEPNSIWPRLVAAARRADDGGDPVAPFGFSTRVAALAMAAQRPAASILERLSLRAMGVACLIALAGIAVNYTAIHRAFADDAPSDDPISELVDIAS